MGRSKQSFKPWDREARSSIRILAEQVFSRAAGAPLIPGNRVRILKDAKENYPAWLEAIREAERTIHFESYIIHDDDIGREFVEAFAAKARQGVRVRVIYDWVGALGASSRRLWRPLKKAGAEVRCYNPPSFDSPFGWLSRDHRKTLTIDGRVSFVTGLCVGRMWVGYPERGLAPWRDTGLEVRGPAVIEIEKAFAQVWNGMGEPIPQQDLPESESIAAEGDVDLRVVASVPNMAGLYRLDLLIAAVAQKSLWLTDAYFLGTTPYVQALRSAAANGVDVRLLVPKSSDVFFIGALSRAGYRPLLEAGVRVFEWNGSMLHAKTAVADGRWARIGSTNLNLTSLLGNWEIDVAVEDKRFAQSMEEMYLEDLANSTEIILSAESRVRPIVPSRGGRLRFRIERGSAGRAAAGAMRIGNAVGAAIANRRLLGPAEARVMAATGLLLIGLSVIAAFWPSIVAYPFAIIGAWVALSLLLKAYKLRNQDNE